MTTLGILWFALVGVLLAGYAVFDGFDLGVGVLHPFLGKTEDDKAAMRTAIGPVWDGNEVWLLTGGGALFAAFPAVYATVFSGFYLALMLVLFALIFRAVSFEYRAHDPAWAKLWDWAFFGGSAIPALLFGVAVGNIVRGVPLGLDREFAGTFFTLLNPYALIIGVTGLAMFLTQGASWLAVKTTGGLYDRSVKLRSVLAWVFAGMVLVAAAATWLFAPRAFAQIVTEPLGWAFLALLLVALVWQRLAIGGKKDLSAWYAVSLAVVSLVGLWAASIFPDLVPALGNEALSLTIANSASSELTLTVMTIIAAIGVPLVLFYFFLIYRSFAGKVEAHGEGY